MTVEFIYAIFWDIDGVVSLVVIGDINCIYERNKVYVLDKFIHFLLLVKLFRDIFELN